MSQLLPSTESYEAQRLIELQRLEILDTPPEECFDNLTELASGIFDMPTALVSLVDDDRLWFKSRFGLEISQAGRHLSFCSYVVATAEPLIVENAQLDWRFRDSSLVTDEPCIRFYAGIPLCSPKGYVLGTLNVIDYQPRTLSDAALEHLKMLAKQAEQMLLMHGQRQQLLKDMEGKFRSSARYRAIIEGAGAGIIRTNFAGIMLEVNPSVETLLGYKPEELIGRRIEMLMPEKWACEHARYMNSYMKTGRARVIGKGREVSALHREGYEIPVHLAVSEVVYPSGQKQKESREFIGILSDLRDVYSAREREHKERALLRVLHQGLTDYHALLSGNTLWGFLKNALVELTGSQYALIGEVQSREGQPTLKVHAVTDLSWNEESKQLMAKLVSGDMQLTNPESMLGRVFAGGEVVLSNDLLNDAKQGDMPPGHPVLNRYIGVPIIDRGEVIGMYAVANADEDYDLSMVEWLQPFTSTCALLINLYRQLNHQAEFMQGLEGAREQAEQANKAKTEFLSSMSHELRTPLNSILGFAQLLQFGKDPLAQPQLCQVEQIRQSGQHLLDLINEVLDLASIESGYMHLSPQSIEVNKICAEVCELLQPMAEQYQVTLVAHPCLNERLIFADYIRVKQILLNLGSNGIKYNRLGGEVSFSCEERGKQLRIKVQDTGVGIPEEKLNLLFQPFNRLGAESGPIEGTGVGLALTHKLVTLMGGDIGVKANPEGGSEFWFELPGTDHLCALQEAAEMPESALTADVEGVHRVLYIEDNPANRSLMEAVFAELDYCALCCAPDAEQGIEKALEQPPALILMDIDLPGMCGISAQTILKNNPLTEHVPIVAVTAGVTEQERRQASTAGFAAYLTKPLDITRLTRTIRHLLSGSAQQ